MTRYRGLDGLRGLAALVVLVHHVLLLSPQLSDAYRGRPVDHPGPVHWFTWSPLHLVWAGTEAVLVFFVLSGFVLSTGVPRWLDYYPRRVVRLYVPVVAALLVALVLARWARPSEPEPGASDVYNAHVGSGTLHAFLHDAPLWHAVPTYLDGPVWSLHWEVLFSLALPAYLLLLRLRSLVLAGAAAAALVVLSAAASAHGGVEAATPHAAAVFLPVFALGVLAAGHRDRLGALAERWAVPLLVGGALLVTAHWTLGRGTALGPAREAAATAASEVGAAALVVAFLAGPVARWAGGSPVPRWLGRRSFSLYLVHVPVVISVAWALGPTRPVWQLGLVAVPLSLLAAELFGRLVEEPAHDLSKRVGAAVATPRRP